MRFSRLKINDAGYMTVAAAGFSAALVVLCVLLAQFTGELIANSQAQLAADQAAIAGALALAGGDSEQTVCSQATWVAELNDAELTHCRVAAEDLITEVVVRGRAAKARAGPV